MRQVTRWLVFALAVVGLALAAGCGEAERTTQAQPLGGMLTGPVWVVDQVAGEDGKLVAPPTGARADAVFDATKVSGSTGVNGYGGTYTSDAEGAISVGALAVTKRAAAPELMTFETQFLAAMDAARGYSAEDTELTLFDEAGEALLVLSAEEPASLSGVKWNAIAINNGKQAVASLVAGSEVTATFGEDGKVAGSGGVNEYSGPFTNEEGALKIGPLVSTKMAGADEAVNAQETAFFAAMERSTTYEISGDELNLRDADGATQVQFQAAK